MLRYKLLLTAVFAPDIDVITPARDPRFSFAEHLCLLWPGVSPRTCAQGTNDERVGLVSMQLRDPPLDETDWLWLLEQCLLIRAMTEPPGLIAINLTTLPTALALIAQRAAAKLSIDAFAITDHDEVVWASGPLVDASLVNLRDDVSVAGYFSVFGYDIEYEVPELDEAEFFGIAHATINGAADESNAVNGQPLVGGYWFETYTWMACRRAFTNLPVNQIVRAVRLFDASSKLAQRRVVAEFDVCLMLNNVLHIIECKAGRTSSTPADAFKLDALANLNGLNARCALVRLHSGGDHSMASRLDVRVISGAAVKRLGTFADAIKGWAGEAWQKSDASRRLVTRAGARAPEE